MKRISSDTTNDVHIFNETLNFKETLLRINQQSTVHAIMTRFGTLE